MKVETARAILEAVKAHVARAVEPLHARIGELEGALAKATAELADKVAAIPLPKDGADGHTPTPEELRALIMPLIPPAPVVKDGVDGRTPTTEELRALIMPLIPPAPVAKDGRDGIDGKDGVDGANGKDGVDGRDALHLEILPGIDESKSVPRGTYATHRGGLWRAFEKTSGMRGWECIVNGVFHAEFEQHENLRWFHVGFEMADGTKKTAAFHVPAILDKGVYKAGEAYEIGDAVTWSGSLWIKQPKEDGKPHGHPGEIESGWRLAVKAGRPGRDGKDFTPAESKPVRV